MSTARIELPILHKGQEHVKATAKRFNVLECGRRFGKTTLGVSLAADTAIRGDPVFWGAPSYKLLADPWRDLNRVLAPIVSSVSKQEHRLELITGGCIDFWTLDGPHAGRGRKYARAIMDECGYTPDLEEVFTAAVRPTLADLQGDAWFLSTPRGHNYFHRLFLRGECEEPHWRSWRKGSIENPHIPASEIEEARKQMSEQHFRQEFEGIPADDGGNPFGLQHIAACVGKLSDDEPIAYGIDLAKSVDWTVMIGLDAQFRVCRYARWQSPWRETISRIKQSIGCTPTLIDSTGVGDPIVEELQRTLPQVQGYKFTSQSKQQLMEGLAVAIQHRTVTYPDGPIRSELEVYGYEYTKTGVRYTAPEGMHDDCVCSLALAVQHANNRPIIAAGWSDTSTVVNIDHDRFFDNQ